MAIAVRVPVHACHCARPFLTQDRERCFLCGHPPMGLDDWRQVLPIVTVSATELIWRTRPGRCVRCDAELDELTIGPLMRYCSTACRQAASRPRRALRDRRDG